MQDEPICTDPTIGQLLHEFLAGRLAAPDRRHDARSVITHTRSCQSCRETMLEFAHNTVTIPTLREFAERRGVTFEEMFRDIAEQLRISKNV